MALGAGERFVLKWKFIFLHTSGNDNDLSLYSGNNRIIYNSGIVLIQENNPVKKKIF